jgi:nucleoside-diphosphate-sugar epimerase
MIYGETLPQHSNLNLIKGDIRDQNLLKKIIKNIDVVIHLACISNDPSFELNPKLGKDINLNSFAPLVEISKKNNVRKFIYASSSSVYGVKDEKNVHEEMSLEPLTDYSRFKADCEKILFKHKSDNFITIVLRPATVCGFSPRQRLDLVVNILTSLAFHKREITVLGGGQLRPNIHIQDMARAYELFIEIDDKKINGEIFNVGFENKTVDQLASNVKEIIGEDIKILRSVSNDNRSYHISSDKIFKLLEFKPKFTIFDAISDLKKTFENKLLIDALNNENYYNIKKMKNINLA